ncbi:MAG: Do family serine endopeptidase [Planctomycetes bacterium]|nr:Do family serine endopeptidase [Planctomycetota bacterium]
MIETVAPSVVTVYASRTAPARQRMIQPFFDNDPLWRHFFRDLPWPFPPQRDGSPPTVTGQGSGVIIAADGLVVTNHHVIEGATTIEVQLVEQARRVTARLVGADPKTDLALLRIEAPQLRPIVIADSDRVRVGDLVFAIGNPFGVGQTVSMGIVSAKGRSNLGLADYEDFIQTDASINPGNSGGALVDSLGRLIGINTAIYSRSGGNIGIGFAVPSNLMQQVVQQLVKGGRVVRGYFGVHIGPVTPELARKFGVEPGRGALVSEVVPESPAARAGLQEGDVIIRVGALQVHDPQQLRLHVAGLAPGTTIEVAVLRDRRELTLQLTVGEQPQDSASVEPASSGIGVELQDLTVQARQEYRIPARVRGALIVAVAPNSRAERAGLREGMVITEIERRAVPDAATAQRWLRQDGEILVRVWFDGSWRWIVVPSE